jgi:hypothetical protein
MRIIYDADYDYYENLMRKCCELRTSAFISTDKQTMLLIRQWAVMVMAQPIPVDPIRPIGVPTLIVIVTATAIAIRTIDNRMDQAVDDTLMTDIRVGQAVPTIGSQEGFQMIGIQVVQVVADAIQTIGIRVGLVGLVGQVADVIQMTGIQVDQVRQVVDGIQMIGIQADQVDQQADVIQMIVIQVDQAVDVIQMIDPHLPDRELAGLDLNTVSF